MTTLSQDTKQSVALSIYESGLIKFGSFNLKSGIVSPFYIDLRQAQSFPDTFHVVTAAYVQMLSDTNESVHLAGVPEAATPLAAAVGYELRRSLVQPRKVVKDHGTKSSVEGSFEAGDKVVLIDDLITKGDSKIEAIKQVEDAGLVVDKFLVLIDREQGGMDMIRAAGYEIEAAMTITELLDALNTLGKMTPEQYEQIMNFVRNN